MKQPRKHHLLNLSEVQVPTHHPRDSKLLSLSIPIFYSPKGRNALFLNEDQNFDEEAFKKIVCLSSVWAAVSIATNTDLCENGMPIYFHVEDTIMEKARPVLQACGVPDDWIRETTIKQPETEVVEAIYGKKMAVYDDESVDTEIVIVWDGDAHVYRQPGQPVLEWYNRFETDLRAVPVHSFYSEWNGGDVLYANWLLRGAGLAEREFPDDDPEEENNLKLAETDAYKSVGLDRVPNQQQRWGAAVISVPRAHGLFEHIRQNYWKSYAEEALITMYMNSHPETSFCEVSKELLPFIQTDQEFIDQKESCIMHTPGVSLEDLPKYKNKMLRGIDGRSEAPRANLATYDSDEVSEANLIANKRKDIRVHILSVPHNPSHKDFSTCAFAQKARKLAYMADLVGYETYHYGNELSKVQCTEHVTVTTEADLQETYGDFITQSEFYKWSVDHYAYKVFFLRAEHELRKRFMPGDIICYVFAPGQKPLYDKLQDLPDAIHCESGIGYYYPYAPYRVHESPGVMHFNLGIAQGRYDQWNNQSEADKKARPYNPNTEIHHSFMQWYEAVIPNSFDMEDFTYSEKNDDYFLCLGRIMPGKGIEIAMRVAHALGKKLIVAGQGDFEKSMGFGPWKNVELFGRADVEQRRELLSNCIALFCLSTYPEPFGGVHIEANLSGKPVIATDFGAYCRSVKSGLTGYRCRLNVFEQAVWAARNVERIDPAMCRRWGQRFRNERVALSYDEYFASVHASLKNNQSPFWMPNPERTNLDWVDDRVDWMSDPIL